MTLTVQFYTMLAMIGMGSWLGATLDTYGRFLKRPKRAKWLVFINDWLFWVIQGLVIFYILLSVNKGELRFYIFLALLCGYALYQSLLRTLYLHVLEFMIRIVVAIIKFVTIVFQTIIIKPLQLLFQLLIVILIGIWKITVFLSKFLLKVVVLGLKILFAPITWIFLFIWRLLPVKYKYILQKYFRTFAGFFRKLKNIKTIFQKWWNNRRKP